MSPPSTTLDLLNIALGESSAASAVESVVAPAALLLALRWADEHDSERAAIALFNGEEAEAILSPELRWASWRESPRPLSAQEVGTLWEGIRGVLGLPFDPRNTHHEVRLPSGRLLSAIVDWLEQLPLDTPAARRQAGEAFTELVLQTMDATHFGGELFTPRAMGRLMVALADPQPGERIYDPCFGVGGLLVDAAETLWWRGRDLSPGEWTRAQRVPMFGVEKQDDLHLVAFVRLLLAGARPALEVGDALEREAAGSLFDQGFDCVLADPPFGMKVEGRHLYHFPIRGRVSENLFIQHAVRSLRPGGRAVVSVPPGLLFRGGADYELRKWLLGECCVEMVLTLPGKSLGYTAIAPSLLVIRRAPTSDEVLFAEISSLPEGTEASRALVRELRSGESSSANKIQRIPVEELHKADFNLTPPVALSPEIEKLLEAGRKKTEFYPLGEVAEVITGHHIAPTNLLDKPVPGSLPIIRGSDIPVAMPSDSGRHVTPAAVEAIPRRTLVYEGDLLIARMGKLGLSSLIGPARPGPDSWASESQAIAIAHQSITVVRPNETLDARFLQAVLKSEALQAQIRARATRLQSTYQVSASVLRDLLVPVPPPAIQQRVLRRLADRPGDALEALLGILSGAEDGPLVRLFEQDSAIGRLTAEGLPEPQELHSLGYQAFLSLRRLRNQAAHLPEGIEPRAQRWLETVVAAPVVSERRQGEEASFELLESSRTILERALETAPEVGGLVGRQATRLTERLLAWIDGASSRAAGQYRLEVDSAFDGLATNRSPVFAVTVRLSGDVPLMDFTAQLDVSEERMQVAELAPGTVATLRARLGENLGWNRSQEGQTLACQLMWSARRVDGKAVNGTESLLVRMPSTSPMQSGELLELGVSPYITGDVVDNPEMFVGRSSILDDLKTHLGGGARVILLEGNRRTGKTSILRQLQRGEFGLTDAWVLAECSFQGTVGDAHKDGIPTEGVFRLLVRDIGLACAKAGLPVPLPEMEEATNVTDFRFKLARALNGFFEGIDPYEALQIYVDMVTQAIAPRRLLLMLDEFDKLQVGIDNGVTSPQVPENIRNLLQTRPSVSAILTGLRSLKRLREEYWSALFGFGHRIGVDPLDPEEVSDLVTRPVAGRLTYAEEAIAIITSLTARQPYLVQSLCARIFELAKRNGWRFVRREEVLAAVDRLVSNNDHFQALWSYAMTERRRYLMCLCLRLSEESQRVNAVILNEHLSEAGIVVPTEEVDEDVNFLVELELVTMVNTRLGPQYELTIPLMSRWMERNIDADAQRRKAQQEQRVIANRGDVWNQVLSIVDRTENEYVTDIDGDQLPDTSADGER